MTLAAADAMAPPPDREAELRVVGSDGPLQDGGCRCSKATRQTPRTAPPGYATD